MQYDSVTVGIVFSCGLEPPTTEVVVSAVGPGRDVPILSGATYMWSSLAAPSRLPLGCRLLPTSLLTENAWVGAGTCVNCSATVSLPPFSPGLRLVILSDAPMPCP